MKTRTAILSLVVFLLFSTYAWTEWHPGYPGIIHAHSTFSDGNRIPEQLVSRAKDAGASFLVVTDHYEQINGLYQFDGSAKRGAMILGYPLIPIDRIVDLYGFGNYRTRFSKYASPDFVIIPGAEITTYWATSSRDPAASHTLALGDLAFNDEFGENALVKLQGKADTQQAVTNRLNELNLVSVAAHPSLVCPYAFRLEWEAISNCQFDPMGVKGIKGFEFFNDYDEEGYRRTLDWYLRLLRQDNDVFVTSGCDSHDSRLDFVLDKLGRGPWSRKTWVFSEKLEAKSLLSAMASGQTYAANHGASFGYLNYIPGFQAPEQELDRAKLVFWVAFEKKTSSPKTVKIYQDGNLAYKSDPYPKGLKRIDCTWEDKGIEGEHRYVIEVEGVLITSPIKLKIRTQVIPEPREIEGKYFSQEDPEDYLELRRNRTATWDCHYYACGVPPEDVRWIISDNRDTVYLYGRTESRWKIEFLIKGNGVIVESLNGTAWVKEGARYSFSPEEVSGIYKAGMKKLPLLLSRYNVEVEVWKCWPPETLVLRPDGTCTYTMEPIIAAGIKVIAEGRWEIEGNRISVELDLLGRREKSEFRVLDRDTLIQSNWPRLGYTDWVREGTKVSDKEGEGETYKYETMTISKQFSLTSDFGDRLKLDFEVVTPGKIILEATWTSEARTVDLALILNGPGQIGYYARKDGASPLRVEYTVTAQDVAKGKTWTASIVNFSERGPVSGTLKVIYPVQG